MSRLLPASTFDVPRLTELFNAGFSGYLLPMHMSEEAFRDHLGNNDIDLDISQVVDDDGPVAFALVARRGDRCWIGGMGTTPEYRRRGLGELALVAGIEAARARGCLEVSLEVLTGNDPAVALYAKLGFQTIRDLAVWSLSATGAPADPAAEPVELVDAQRWIAAHRTGAEPWQRSDGAITAFIRRGMTLRSLVINRGSERVAAAIVREHPDVVSVLQIAAADQSAAADALLAAAGANRGVRLSNVPADDIASVAIEHLGADLVATQHEMSLSLA